MEKTIQIAIAKADMILCNIAHYIPALVISVVVGVIVGVVVYKKCCGRYL